MRLTFIFLLLNFGFQSSSQNNYTFFYKFSYSSDDTLMLRTTLSPLQLVVQDSIAFCYHTKTVELNKEDTKVPLPLGGSFWPKSMFLDKKSCKTVSFRGHLDKPSTQFLQKEKCDSKGWKIFEDDKKFILGMQCTKAEGKINGRIYIVWFASSFPGGFGPFYLTTLPGVVLESYNTDSGILCRAVGIYETALPVTAPAFKKKNKN